MRVSPEYLPANRSDPLPCPAGERSLHTGEVVGSIPTAPTTNPLFAVNFCAVDSSRPATRNRTQHETNVTIREKSVDFVLRVFMRYVRT
jgi:hypothetical protein